MIKDVTVFWKKHVLQRDHSEKGCVNVYTVFCWLLYTQKMFFYVYKSEKYSKQYKYLPMSLSGFWTWPWNIEN